MPSPAWPTCTKPPTRRRSRTCAATRSQPRAGLFTGADRGDLLDFLRTRLAPNSGGHAAGDTLLRSAVAPSKQLLKVAADEVRDREQFRLLGNQQLAVDLVHHAVEQARGADSKRVIVVSGGPGSGKSVVALSLLGELARQGRSVLHATGSRSFTQTLRKVAGARAPRVQKMFKYFNQFMTAERNGLDVLILDEAHRIRATSVDRYTKAALRTERPQLDELIAAARVPVSCSTSIRWCGPGRWARWRKSCGTPSRWAYTLNTCTWGSSFAAVAARSICCGRRSCSV